MSGNLLPNPSFEGAYQLKQFWWQAGPNYGPDNKTDIEGPFRAGLSPDW